jgi:hypothetical protein
MTSENGEDRKTGVTTHGCLWVLRGRGEVGNKGRKTSLINTHKSYGQTYFYIPIFAVFIIFTLI